MALQGVLVDVHDIDIQTDQEGAYEVEHRLIDYVKQPVRYSAAERIRSHLGVLEIDGIKVEIMGALQKRIDHQGWEDPVEVKRFQRWVEIDEMRIPVLSLEYEQQAYQNMGRVEKAEMLRQWLLQMGTHPEGDD